MNSSLTSTQNTIMCTEILLILFATNTHASSKQLKQTSKMQQSTTASPAVNMREMPAVHKLQDMTLLLSQYTAKTHGSVQLLRSMQCAKKQTENHLLQPSTSISQTLQQRAETNGFTAPCAICTCRLCGCCEMLTDHTSSDVPQTRVVTRCSSIQQRSAEQRLPAAGTGGSGCASQAPAAA
jgi:hypothetical protein